MKTKEEITKELSFDINNELNRFVDAITNYTNDVDWVKKCRKATTERIVSILNANLHKPLTFEEFIKVKLNDNTPYFEIKSGLLYREYKYKYDGYLLNFNNQ